VHKETIVKHTITRHQAIEMIRDSAGRIVSVTFIKRTTGEPRTMQVRTGVRSRLAGGPAAYDPRDHRLLWVFSMDADGYRSIPEEGITSIRANGKEFQVQ
jgi:hypothetical protein